MQTLTGAEPRTQFIMVRLSEDEKDLLMKSARQAGARSVSGYVRDLVLGLLSRKKPKVKSNKIV